MTSLFRLEAAILLFIQDLRFPFFDALMPLIGRLDDGGIICIVLCLALIVPKQTRRVGVECAAALVLAFIACNFIFKPIVARPRPFDCIDALSTLINAPTDHSFPSGHAGSCFACACSLTMTLGKRGAWSLIPASLISFSRLYVGVHYPTDVLFGALLGLSCAFAVHMLSKRFFAEKE